MENNEHLKKATSLLNDLIDAYDWWHALLLAKHIERLIKVRVEAEQVWEALNASGEE